MLNNGRVSSCQLTKTSIPNLASARPSGHDLSNPSASSGATKACITSLPEELTLQICHHLLSNLRPWRYLYLLDDRYQMSELIQQLQEHHLWIFSITCRRHRRIVRGFLGDTIAISRFDHQQRIINQLRQIGNKEATVDGVKKMFFCLPSELDLKPFEIPLPEPVRVKAEFAKQFSKLPLEMSDPRVAYDGSLAAVFLCQFHNLRHLALASSGRYLEQIVEACSSANEPPLPMLQSVTLRSERAERSQEVFNGSQEMITASIISGILRLGKQVSELCIQDFNISQIQRIPAVDHLKSVTLKETLLEREEFQTLFSQCEHMEHFVYVRKCNYSMEMEASDIVAALGKSTKTLTTLCIHTFKYPWWIYLCVSPFSVGEFKNLRNLWIDTFSTASCVTCIPHYPPVTGQDIASTFMSTLPTSLRKLHLKGTLYNFACVSFGGEDTCAGWQLCGDLTLLADDGAWEKLPNLEELAVDAETYLSENGRRVLRRWEKPGLRILRDADAFPELW
ncbi:hypothetical protein CCHR01_14177 [Colletotrichum chrysophilum]|uniref:Uncharacterized protein n=1 Tax=Colletotrichum chrysophilum TaxID=1836956 RepID=A0AAD9ECI4_9PEZI|nr:hypothetical protein CCHR01_14177 [Colletotrichum chrysophilum]